MPTNPFDYVNAITESKELLDTEGYQPYIVNLALSLHADTVLFANEMNRRHQMPNSAQFSFLINSVRQRKRFSRWPKKLKSESLDIVREYYGFNDQKAKAALAILSEEDIEVLKQRLAPGGIEK